MYVAPGLLDDITAGVNRIAGGVVDVIEGDIAIVRPKPGPSPRTLALVAGGALALYLYTRRRR